MRQSIKRFALLFTICFFIVSPLNLKKPQKAQANSLSSEIVMFSGSAYMTSNILAIAKPVIGCIPPEVYFTVADILYDGLRTVLNKNIPSYLPNWLRFSFCEANPTICSLTKAIEPMLEVASIVDNQFFQSASLKQLGLINKSLKIVRGQVSNLKYMGTASMALLALSIIHTEMKFRENERANQRRHKIVMAELDELSKQMQTMEIKLSDLLKKNETDRVLEMVNVAITCPKKLGISRDANSLSRCINHIEKAREALQRKELLPDVNLQLSHTEALLHQLVDSKNSEATKVIKEEAEKIFTAVINKHLLMREFCKTYGLSNSQSKGSSCKPSDSWIAHEIHTQIKDDFGYPQIDIATLVSSYRRILSVNEINTQKADELVAHIQQRVNQKIKTIAANRSASFNDSLKAAFKPWKSQFRTCQHSSMVNRIVNPILKHSSSEKNVQFELNKQLSANLVSLINTELEKRGHSTLPYSKSISTSATFNNSSSYTGTIWGSFATLNTGALGMVAFAGYTYATAGVVTAAWTAALNALVVPSFTLAAIGATSLAIGGGVKYYLDLQEYEKNLKKYTKQICREVLVLDDEILKRQIRQTAQLGE